MPKHKENEDILKLYEELKLLANNLKDAVYSHDPTAELQCAGAVQEFMDKNK